MASPPQCPVCSANTTEKMRYHDEAAVASSLVGLNCGHFVVCTNGAWQRIGTYNTAASAPQINNHELPGAVNTTTLAKAATSFVALSNGKKT